jgi:chromosome partitioning protein
MNLKPGVGKTTSAVWLAFALHELGIPVLLADTDPAASALAWSDEAGGFPFGVIGLPSNRVHASLRSYAPGPNARIVVDVPQMEDHKAIATSVGRITDKILVCTAPNRIEIERMTPVRNAIEEVEVLRNTPIEVDVLFNRTVANAASTGAWRDALTGDGWHVIGTEISRRELYAQSFGTIPDLRGSEFLNLARELEGIEVPPEKPKKTGPRHAADKKDKKGAFRR